MPSLGLVVAALLVLVVCTILGGAASAGDRTRGSGAPPGFQEAYEKEQLRLSRRREERARPEAKEERRRSRTAFRGKSRREAVELARSRFANVFRQPVWNAGKPSRGRVVRYLNDYSYLFDPGDGHNRVVQAFEPLLAEDESGRKAPIDTDLVAEGAALEPANPRSRVRLGRRAAAGVAFPESSIQVKLAGVADSKAKVIDDKAFYPEVEPDTDLAVAALPGGVETFLHLRSSESPERATLDFTLPAGVHLERPSSGDLSGGVRIVRGEQVIGQIGSVSAIDAEGEPVPATYSLNGDALTIEVDHRGGDWHYPILVDPYIVEAWRFDQCTVEEWNKPAPNKCTAGQNHGWTFGENGPTPGHTEYDCSQIWWCDSSTGLGGPGLYLHARPTAAGPGEWQGWNQMGAWAWQAPPDTSIVVAEFNNTGMTTPTGGTCYWGMISAANDRWSPYPNSSVLFHCGSNASNHSVRACATDCGAVDIPRNFTAFGMANWGTLSPNGTWIRLPYATAELWEGHRPFIAGADGLTSPPPSGWVDQAEHSFNIRASDRGLGIEKTMVEMPRSDGSIIYPTKRYTPCGGRTARCPNEVPAAGAPNQFYYSTNSLREGESTFGIQAIDIVGNPSTGDWQSSETDPARFNGHRWTVKVDRSPPDSPVQLSGPMANKYVGENPTTLGTVATDPHSGVKSTELQVAGSPLQAKESSQPTPCSAASGCPSTHDTRNGPFTWNTAGFAEGPHQYTVTARDPLNHPRTEGPRTVRIDRTKPDLTLSGELYTRRFLPRQPPDTPQTLPPGSYNLHMDGFDGFSAPPPNNKDGSGMKSFKVYVAGQKLDGSFLDYGPPQTFGPLACPDGNCHWDEDWTLSTSQYQNETGVWRIKVEAIDQVENTSKTEFTVKIDQPGVSSADMLGLEDWWQYDSTPTGAGSAAHVNVANGNLVWHSVPIVNPGRGLSTVVNLTYNSQLRQPVPLLESPVEQAYAPYNEAGTGFSIGVSSLTRLNERLNVDLAAAGRITLTDPDGTQHLFESSPGSDVFNPPRGVNIHLRRFSKVQGLGIPDPTGYVPLEQPDQAWAATRPDGVTHFFDQRGYQRSVVDRNGNTITFEYTYHGPTRTLCTQARAADGNVFSLPEVLCPRKLDKAVDAGGREIQFNYEPRLIAALPPALNPSGANDCKVTSPEGEEIELPECASGPLSAITDHAGRVTRFRYTSEGYLSSLALAASGERPRVVRFAYENEPAVGAVEPLIAVMDPRGSRTKFEYHAAETPVPSYLRFHRKIKAIVDREEEPAGESSTDPDGNPTDPEKKTAFAYASNPDLTTVTDTRGFPTTYEIGEDDQRPGRLRELTDARGHKTKLEWDNELGQATDDNNLARLTRHAAGGAEAAPTAMTYNQNGMLLTSTDRARPDRPDRVTRLTYADSSGPVALRSQRPGSIDSSGTFVSDLTQISRPKAGSDTQFVYDNNDGSRIGNVTQRIDAEGETAETFYVPNGGGNIAREVDEADNETEYTDYDANGLPQTVKDPRDKTWRYTYDAVGNLLTAKDPRATGEVCPSTREKFRRQFEYDDFDQLVKEHVPKDGCDFIERTFRHDENGNQIAETDGHGATTSSTYTRMDNVDRRISAAAPHADPVEEPQPDPDGNPPPPSDGTSAETTNLDYDTEENLTRVNSPKGELTGAANDFSTEFRYNAVGERVASIRHNPDGNPAKLATGFFYDGRGNVIGVSDPKNNEAGGEPESNAGDPAKRRYTFEYDLADNRERAIEDPIGQDLRTEYDYDENDNLKEVTDPRGAATGADDFKTTYCYDDRDLLEGAIDGAGNHTRYELLKDGKLGAEISPRGMPTGPACDATPKGSFRTEYDYFETGELKSRSLPMAPDQYAPLNRKVTYERNDVGDPTKITDARGNAITSTFFDTGELMSTTRPSWWTFDPEMAAGGGDDPLGSKLGGPAAAGPGSHDTGEVRERTPEEMLADDGKAPDLPRSEGFGDYGEVEPQEAPDLMPRTTSGGKTTFDYDDEMRLRSISPVVGTGAAPTVSIDRDPLGRITQTTQPLDVAAGRQIVNAYGYDHNGNLRTHQISGAGGDADPERVKTTLDYDQFDRLTRSSSPGTSQTALEETEYTYDANDNVSRRKTPVGPSALMAYDAVDRVTHMANPTTDLTDPFDATNSPGNEVTKYEYDKAGNMLTETSPEDRLTTRTYDAANRVKSVDGPLVEPTTYEYDENGNQTEMVEPGANSGNIVTKRTFDGRDLKWSESIGTDEKRTTVTEYDPNGNLRRTVNPAGVDPDTDGTPDAKNGWDGGPLTITSNAAENATVREYSADNQLTSIHLPYGDPDGTGAAPSDSRRWRQDLDRDDRGRVKFHKAPYDWSDPCPDPPQANDPGCPSTSSYTYFDTDWVKSMSDPQLSDPDPTRVYSHDVAYDYDVRGNQVSWKSPKGQAVRRSVTRRFFPNGMLMERKAVESDKPNDPRTYTYEYNKNHSLTLMTDLQKDPDRSTRVTYDEAERPTLVNERWTQGRDTAIAYDKDGLTTTRRTDGTVSSEGDPTTYSGGKTTTFHYDGAGREDRIWVCTSNPAATCPQSNATRRTETSYYAGSSFVHTRTKPNDVVETFQFLDDAKLERMRRDKGTNELKSQSYHYDDNGNRIEDERGKHLFNARSQLIEWTRGPKAKIPGSKVCYELNGAGAMTKKTDSVDSACGGAGDTVTTFSYNGDRLTSTQDTVAPAPALPPVKYHYDDFGSIERIAPDVGLATTFDYDEFGRMIKSRGPAETADRDYTYDGLDRRDTRTVGSKVFDFAYIGMTEKLSREEAPQDIGGTKVHYYDYDSGLRRQGKQTMGGLAPTPYRSYGKDANGSVEGLEQDDGEFVGGPAFLDRANYRYDPYGELEDEEVAVGDEEARENPFRFEGFYYDSGIKTYDMQARPYRPEVGRFLTQDRYEAAAGDLNLEADPITQNRYAFAGGNPVNRIEWDGHCNSICKMLGKGGKSKGGGGGGGSSGSGTGSGTGSDTATTRGTSPAFQIAPTPIAARQPPARVYLPRCNTPVTKDCARASRRDGDGVDRSDPVGDLLGFLRKASGPVSDFHPYTAGPKLAYRVQGKARQGDVVGVGVEVGTAALGVRGKAAGGLARGAGAVRGGSPQVRNLAEANITKSADTVLGHFPGYIDKARAKGASYFDIGHAWNTLTRAQRTAANQHFLDRIAASRDRVLLSVPKTKIRPGSGLADEIRYLTQEKNYRWVNQWSLRPR